MRQIFNAWYLSMQIWPEYLKYLTQFASPSLKGILPEKPLSTRDPKTGLITQPAQVLFDALVEFENGSVVVAQYGTEIAEIFSQGDGTAFTQAMSFLNHEKVKGILHSVLATEAPHNQTRAAQSGGKDILDLPTRGLKNGLCSMMHRQVFKKLMYFNFGQNAANLFTPYATLGDVAIEDRNEAIRAFSAAGFHLAPSQVRGASLSMELEPPSQEEEDLMLAAMKLEAVAPEPVKPLGQPNVGSTGK